MAHGGHRVDREKISCSICLDLLRDPVTTSCGHSFCGICINIHWDKQDQRGTYSCPHCRETFRQRPDLKKNTMLSDLVEELKKTVLQVVPVDHCHAGAEDVASDVCTGRKLKARRSRLQRLVSYSLQHLLPHFHPASSQSHRARTNISETETQVDTSLSESEPRTRAEFLTYSRDITLDPNTAHRRLLISDGNRKVACVFSDQRYSDHPERFTGYTQVLSEEGLTGRCYWEVEMRGNVCVAVSYKSISRAGWPTECEFGGNHKSWSLYYYSDRCVFWYNETPTFVPGPRSSRVGVYLDHSAGILSFYRVSKTMTLLHRVETIFTEPLHAGLRFFFAKTSAELCKPK